MRFAGRISNWNDDKGYGFVMPIDGGVRAFVHIKSLPAGSRRPADGDLVSYVITTDSRGRPNAAQVRFAGQRIEEPRVDASSKSPARRRPVRGGKPMPRAVFGVSALLLSVLGTFMGWLPTIVPVALALLSSLSFLQYWLDKAAAGRDQQRVPESRLLLLDFAGGWPGGLIAQQVLRHKTIKQSYQRAFWCVLLANLVLVASLVHGGLLDRTI
jgi:uncharacterized membrane protein YsdA (DUF1294 family)/cold shock CspA family protein